MTRRTSPPRSQKAKAKGRNSRPSGSFGLGRAVRLFQSNKENIPAGHPSAAEDSVYIVPYVQPGAEIYPSVMDFTEFIFGLHRASDRYPSPEPVSPFLRSRTVMSSYDSCFAPEFHQGRFGRTFYDTSREEAARATNDLQDLLREKYPPGEDGDHETGAADADSSLAFGPQGRGDSQDETEKQDSSLPPPCPDDPECDDRKVLSEIGPA